MDAPDFNATLTSGINSIVDFAFWPNQASELAACDPKSKKAEESYLCEIDHFEACAVSKMGCFGGCDSDEKQLQLFQFLYCFEGLHVKPLPNQDYPGPSWLKSLEPCAQKAGIDYEAVKTCASDTSKGSELSKAFETITKYVASTHLKYFPWVELDDKPMGLVYDKCFEAWVCGNYTGSSKPTSCSKKRPKEC